MIGSATLLTVVLVGSLAAAPLSANGQTSPDDASAVVVDTLGFVLVDPSTGTPLRSLSRPDAILGTVAGPSGVVYGSLAASDGSGTDLFAVEAGSWNLHLLGRVPGRAIAKGLSADGQRLRLLEFAPQEDDRPDGPPIGLIEAPVPERWHGTVPVAASRDTGFGVLTPDGRRWLRLGSIVGDEDEPPELVLETVTFAEDGSPTAATLPLPGHSGYHSLLLSPDGRTAYLVDYLFQTIRSVDLELLTILDSVEFGQVRTKRPPCSAALSTSGDRLYLLGNTGAANAGTGVLVFDVATMRQVAHFLPDLTDLYCVAVAPTDDRLYAATFATDADVLPELLTIDAATGWETQRVPLATGGCCTRLVAATGAAATTS